MKQIIIDKNENEQRLDRFLRKYLSEAPKSFIYRMIRKKNIEVNKKRAKPETIIYKGDTIQLFLSDETISKFMARPVEIKSNIKPDLIYEDDNLILINKPVGLLSHGTGDESEEDIVNSMVSYLIEKGDFLPEVEKTFTPSICNRLDRNTSGIIIGAKNYKTLKSINEAMREGKIKRYYKTIVKGNLVDEIKAEAYLIKNQEKNKVEIYEDDQKGSKQVITNIKPLKIKNGYSMLEIELITGRTHQIRGHLSSLGYPVIGDRKYGDNEINSKFNKEYKLNNQFLHAYKIELNGLIKELEYLNGKSFKSELKGIYKDIERELF